MGLGYVRERGVNEDTKILGHRNWYNEGVVIRWRGLQEEQFGESLDRVIFRNLKFDISIRQQVVILRK